MKWDQRYSEEGFAYGLKANDFLVEFSHLFPKGGKILCIAEGEGRNALHLLKEGHSVHGLDLSVVGKEKAQNLAKENGYDLGYEVGDLFEYDFGEEKWDGIVSIFFHCPIAMRENFHRKLEKGLKKGGIYLFEAYAKDQPEFATGGPKDADLLYNATDFDLSKLETLHQKDVKREILEGRYHTGDSSVVQYVGRK
jgi:2-polyprenyl-3-methyl-5-hydroxy-6-metoxy-1,4-benzoquinol methylase